MRARVPVGESAGGAGTGGTGGTGCRDRSQAMEPAQKSASSQMQELGQSDRPR
jgi:hypothetical protein